MLSDFEVMELHIAALFASNERGRLVLINEPNGALAPRFYLGRTLDGNLPRFRFDISDTVVAQLTKMCEKENVSAANPEFANDYVRVLKSHAPVDEVSAGPCYAFRETIAEPGVDTVIVTKDNAHVLLGGFEGWLPGVQRGVPFAAAVKSGKAVSVCYSARVSPRAHEAGVDTLEPFRGRGLAADVCRVWAKAVQNLGGLPLYSTSWNNPASQSVARKLDLRQYGVEFHLR